MGKQKTNINWTEIEQLIMSGCSVREIAGYVGCNERTIYDRCSTDNGETYSTYSQRKRAKGDSLLKSVRFTKALGESEKGDNTLLIWLGKTRLGEREEQSIDHNVKFETVNYSEAEVCDKPKEQ